MELKLSLPLDDDGFLRRACPHCHREFKWKSTSEAAPVVAYHCPYCGRGAAPDQWLTETQVQFVQDHARAAVLEPALAELDRAFDGFKRLPGVRVTGSRTRFEVPPPLDPEPNDMRVVVAHCHADEPVKVAELWSGATFCLMCGKCATTKLEGER